MGNASRSALMKWASQWASPRATRWLLLLAMHLVVGYNAVFHHPYIGYDAGGHLRNLLEYSRLRFPTAEDSNEYFSPPLPYILPALVRHFGLVEVEGMRKLAQAQNALLSLLLCWQLLRLCRLARPDDPHLASWALGLLALMPVYYKSFAFIRGEPMLAALGVTAGCEALVLARTEGRAPLRTAWLGALCGLLILSRQWGFFLVVALAVFLLVSGLRQGRLLRAAATCAAMGLLAGVVGGWFYLRLHTVHGSVMAFNRGSAGRFALSNQPEEFYFALGLPELFTDPLRPSFTNQLIPTFYSELWGDWECYFLVYGKDVRSGRYSMGSGLQLLFEERPPPEWLETNRFTLARYIGRGQLLALLPSLLLLGGLAWGGRALGRWFLGRGDRDPAAVPALATLVVLVSCAGYFGFMVMYPAPESGNTIKATYLLQAFPFLALLAGMWARALSDRWPRVMRWVPLALLLVGLHNLGLCFTRYPRFL